MTIRNYNEIKASEALKRAQFIAIAPFIFQATIAMKKLGIFDALVKLENDQFLSKEEISELCHLPLYTVSILVDLAISADIMIQNEQNRICLSKIGYYLATDSMTNINLDFSHDTCYNSLYYLTDSLKSGKAEGLKVFTKEFNTIYPFLKQLPDNARKSWFGFDHYYSNHVFDQILDILFKEKKFKHICDIGGNTGKFALAATKFNPNIKVTIVDLPEQCEQAKANIKPVEERVDIYPINILDPEQKLPDDPTTDLWLMSQFLDCFSINQIENILQKIYRTMNPNSLVVIIEIFGDKQKNDTASLVIDATSLYFTALANGYSRFYHSRDLIDIAQKVGFNVNKEIDSIGLGHSALILSK